LDEDDKELYRELFSKIETNHDVLNIRKNAHQDKRLGDRIVAARAISMCGYSVDRRVGAIVA
jgi:hypothetical protein